MAAKEEKDTLGITAKKEEDFGEWFSQVIQKADLVDYSLVSGCYVYKPRSYAVWEKIQEHMNGAFKRMGIENCYFPLFIPEGLLKKEQEHVEGFKPEVAWVTETGDSKLNERLAIRPTSETAMYHHYAKWIQSYRDLPLKLNQWCNVVRWEFKNPVPFLRSREFLWQEGHTAHKNKAEAEKEVLQILDLYAEVYEKLYAVPVIKGKKTDSEKFAGAQYTTSVEIFLPNGKAAQGATSHLLGQNFAKAFGISFLDEKEQKQFVWQNSWGLSTRSIGICIMMHSDNKGLVLPPNVAPVQMVIIPIVFDATKEKVLQKAKSLHAQLQESFSVLLDDRDGYTPGWKFNAWEMKGIPMRIEFGPKDMEKNQAVLVRRDTGKKEIVKISEIEKKAKAMLESMQKELYQKASKMQEENTVLAKNMTETKKAIENRKLVKAFWCENEACETSIKDKTEGAKILCIPFAKEKKIGNCVACGKEGVYSVFIAKSY